MSRRLLSIAVSAACGGALLVLAIACSSSEVPVVRDADGSTDAGVSTDTNSLPDTTFDACRNFPPPPTMQVYYCDASTPGTTGCPNDIRQTDTPRHAVGCTMDEPYSGSGCGAVRCVCQRANTADAGAIWFCPD